jgi:hypothetical protein
MTCVTRIVGGTAIGAAMLMALSAPSAQAAFTLDLTQQGSNVVASGSGTIDTTGLSMNCNGCDSYGSYLIPDTATAEFVNGSGVVDGYHGATGPTSFGSGNLETVATSYSGDIVGVLLPVVGVPPVLGEIEVPHGYVSGAQLSDTATYDNATFASLGVTPGTYVWSWGSGAGDDTLTLQIGPAAVPEPSTWAMMLIGFAGLGFAGYRKARKGAASAP